MKRALVSGASGLVGSEVCAYFDRAGFEVHGLDNNQRSVFFGPAADTRWNRHRLESTLRQYRHYELDVRNREGIFALVQELRPNVIIHAAAQPSHDKAAEIPLDDFDINALGTLNLLEASRRFCADSPFIHMSTNKVYGDRPNDIELEELDTRWDFADPKYSHGIPEDFPIDQCTHSLFGASKLAADVLVQEYGRYFQMPTCCLRAGCITGPYHAGVELHGFLSYLVKCHLEGREYRIFGHKGKQVRDNIHAEDVAAFMIAFYEKPRVAEVYNLGGGKQNSCSILEAIAATEALTGKSLQHRYLDESRRGDHIVYYSDLRKTKSHYPDWDMTRTIEQILADIVDGWQRRLASA